MEIDSYKSYLKAYNKTTRITGKATKVVDLKEFCPHRKLDFGHRKYCESCNKIYWKWLLNMRPGLRKVGKRF
ncbi:MAG: hypothetical protein HY361_04545 [Candidatus Aenigmarchaeota archaeon]|nr:hypothetical protein [Candidatus Aenigmarchaeota archaeon]